MNGVGVGYAIVDVWIHQSDFRIARMELHMSDPKGTAALRLVLSQYDSIAPIEVPPPAQLETGAPTPAAT